MNYYWFVLSNVEKQTKRSKMVHRNTAVRPPPPMEVTDVCLALWVVAADLKTGSDKMVVVERLCVDEPNFDVAVSTSNGLKIKLVS